MTSSPGLGPRGNYARGLATREAILAVSEDMFVERGFFGVSVRNVAERCGLSTSGVTHHFKTREELLAAVIEQNFKGTQQWAPGEFARDRGALDVMIALADRVVRDPAQKKLLLVLAATSTDPDHPAHEWYRDRYRDFRDVFAVQVRVDQERGLIRADADPDLVATELVATFEGVFLQWLNDRDAIDPVAVIRSSTDRLRADQQPAR